MAAFLKMYFRGVPVLAGWVYAFCGSMSRNSRRLFCGFPGYKPVPPGWFKIVCWFYVGNTQRLTESCFFMEKPGIESATPGLQGIALIHYTTAASQLTPEGFLWLSLGRNQYRREGL